MKQLRALWVLTITLIYSMMGAHAAEQPLAFPGADGYAKYITGGRGGKVYYVTSLADCTDDNLVPGTLRWALRTGDDTPRTILFAVHGTIYLNSKLKTNHANVSILGQSAPGGGICVTGYPVVINNRNYIVRYIRFRAGDIPALESEGNVSYSGLDIENATQVLLDHCSVTWSMEECLTMFDNDTTTVQYCIVGEGLYHSYNVKTTGDDSGRAFAMQWGGDHSNMHHVLITNCNGRAPRFNGVREARAWEPGTNGKQYAHDCHIDGDFANNVLYNWGGGRLSYYGGEFYASLFADAPEGLDPYNRIYMRNNYFRPGPATQVNGANYRHFFHPSGDNASQVGQWYLSGNKFELSSPYAPSGNLWSNASLETVNADNLAGWGTASSALDLSSQYSDHLLQEIPYSLSGYVPVSADQAYLEVTHATRGAGANLPRYDEEDQRLVDEAGGRRDGVTPFRGSRATQASRRPGIIDTPADITFQGGTDAVTTAAGHTYHCYPSLAMRDGEKYAIDSDGDGMPDVYEESLGLNPKDASDGAAVADNGYTHLENYLNGLADFTLCNADYQTSEVYVAPGAATRPEYITISFDCKDAAVHGQLPQPRRVRNGDVVIFTPTWSLYKEGYTQMGWTDGNMTYGFGTEYRTFVEDVTLYPSLSRNSKNLSDRTDDITLTWDFTLPQAPTLSPSAQGIYVTRGWVDSDSLDVCLTYQGLTLTLPAAEGAVATVTYRNGAQTEYAAVSDLLTLTLTSAAVRSVSLSLPYIFDPTGIDFHAVQVGEGTNYELVYGDTLQIDQRPWMHTLGQRRNAYRNCLNPLGNDEISFSGNDNTVCVPLYGFVVGQSHTSTYKLVAYIQDCARVRTYVSGSNSAGDQMQLTAIPADGSERSQGYHLHKLCKSSNFSEYFDLELDPTLSYMLVWSSVGGNDMMVGAIKFYDKTGTGSTSGDAMVQWTWDQGTLVAEGQTEPSKAFASALASLGGQLYSRSGVLGNEQYAVQVRQRTSAADIDPEHVVEFKISPRGGYQFTPTVVSFSRRFTLQGDDTEGQIDVYFKYGNEEPVYVRQTKSTAVSENISIKATTATFADRFKATSRPFSVLLYLRQLPQSEGVNLWNVQVNGTYQTVPAVKYGFQTQVSPAGSGVIVQSPKGSNFVPEAEITLQATAVDGYKFRCWRDQKGEVLSIEPRYLHSKREGDEVLTAEFEELSNQGIFSDGPFQAIVSNAEELKEALLAARQSSAQRYYIFLRRGEYDFGAQALTSVPQNTSLIGESQEEVLLFNSPSASLTKYQDETPVLYIDQNQNNVYMQDLTIRQARDWGTKVSQGQAIALRQRGKQAIYKNVTLQGIQDTYYLNKADGTAYFEDCTLAGEVDFIYGDGTAYFSHSTLLPLSQSACITAPNTQPQYKGLVFNGCTIRRDPEAKDSVTGYRLGRPWGDSPAATFLYTRMEVQPTPAGWGKMSEGLPLRFHEYGSVDGKGQPLDLSVRTLSQCAPAAGSDDPVLTENQVADYALEKVFPAWSPAQATQQLTAPQLYDLGGVLRWDAVPGAYCYAVVCNGAVIDFTSETSYSCPTSGLYSLRVANAMGGLGAPSAEIEVLAAGIVNLPVDPARPAQYYDLWGRKVNSESPNGFRVNTHCVRVNTSW